MSVHGRFVQGRAWECWPSTQGVTGKGYARWHVDGEQNFAHRVTYEAFVGPIPEGLTIDHRCRNRACVNPYHLEPVTLRVNVYRAVGNPLIENARKTHCIRGHAFDEANTMLDKHGHRRCRVCQYEKVNRINRRRRRAKAGL